MKSEKVDKKELRKRIREELRQTGNREYEIPLYRLLFGAFLVVAMSAYPLATDEALVTAQRVLSEAGRTSIIATMCLAPVGLLVALALHGVNRGTLMLLQATGMAVYGAGTLTMAAAGIGLFGDRLLSLYRGSPALFLTALAILLPLAVMARNRIVMTGNRRMENALVELEMLLHKAKAEHEQEQERKDEDQ